MLESLSLPPALVAPLVPEAALSASALAPGASLGVWCWACMVAASAPPVPVPAERPASALPVPAEGPASALPVPAERSASAPVAPACTESTEPVSADWLDAPDSQVVRLSAVAFCAGRAALAVPWGCVDVPAGPACAVCDRVALDALVLPARSVPGAGVPCAVRACPACSCEPGPAAVATLPPVRSDVMALLDRQAELPEQALSTAAASSAA